MTQEKLSQGMEEKQQNNSISFGTDDLAENLDDLHGSIKFYDKHIETYFNSSINITNENLRNVHIICAEHRDDSHMYTDLFGVDIARRIIVNDRNAKIVLTSFLDFDILKEMLEDMGKSSILNSKNVKFIRLPIDENELNSISFGDATENFKNILEESLTKFVRSCRHTSNNKKERFYEKIHQERALEFYNDFKKEFENVLPNCSYDEFVEFIINYTVDTELKMPGKKLTGVYCDIDGTLLLPDEKGQKTINKKVLDYLKNLEELGKEVHIWTGGNISEQKKVLEDLGIKYPVSSKYDYSGAVAEMIIDDAKEDEFNSLTSITAQSYINVNDIK